MAAKNWKDRLTSADWKNWQAAHQRFLEREAEAWAMSPRNPSLAKKMYPPGLRHLIPDAERGCVSKLGGQAVEARSAMHKSKK